MPTVLERIGLDRDTGEKLAAAAKEAQEEVNDLRRRIRDLDKKASRARAQGEHAQARRLEQKAAELEEEFETALADAEDAEAQRVAYVRDTAAPEALAQLEEAGANLRAELEALGQDLLDALPKVREAVEELGDTERAVRDLKMELDGADRGLLHRAPKNLGTDASTEELVGLFAYRLADAVADPNGSVRHAPPPYTADDLDSAARGELPLRLELNN